MTNGEQLFRIMTVDDDGQKDLLNVVMTNDHCIALFQKVI